MSADELINELKHQNKAINLPPLSAQDNADCYYRRATVVQGSTLTMGWRRQDHNQNSSTSLRLPDFRTSNFLCLFVSLGLSAALDLKVTSTMKPHPFDYCMIMILYGLVVAWQESDLSHCHGAT